jgi:hypothetical protein
MKNKINTTGLFLLMMLGTFGTNAGAMDSTKKDTCCLRNDVKTVAISKDEPLTAPEKAKIAASLQDQVADADATISFQYVASQPFNMDAVSRTDALTNLEMQAAMVEADFTKTALTTALAADKAITESHKKAVSLDVAAFQPENIAKMLRESDKMMNEQHARQSGMEVAISK